MRARRLSNTCGPTIQPIYMQQKHGQQIASLQKIKYTAQQNVLTISSQFFEQYALHTGWD